MDEKKLFLVQRHECLYNLQHKYYDNNLVKYNSWKEIAGEIHAQDKELSRSTQRCRGVAGARLCRGTAWARHGMCVLTLLACYACFYQTFDFRVGGTAFSRGNMRRMAVVEGIS
jgi:hypothetical protein